MKRAISGAEQRISLEILAEGHILPRLEASFLFRTRNFSHEGGTQDDTS